MNSESKITPVANRPMNVGVIIVHGVGEVDAGWSNLAITQPLASASSLETSTAGVSLASSREVYTLDDTKGNGQPSEFNVFLQRAHLANDARLTVAEFYWGDLSRIGKEPISQIFAAMQLVYEGPAVLCRSILNTNFRSSLYHSFLRGSVLLAVGQTRWLEAGITATLGVTYISVWVINTFLNQASRLAASRQFYVPNYISGQYFSNLLLSILLITAIVCAFFLIRRQRKVDQLNGILISTLVCSLSGVFALCFAIYNGAHLNTPVEYLHGVVRFWLLTRGVWNITVFVAFLMLILLLFKRMVFGNPRGAPSIDQISCSLGLAMLQGVLITSIGSLLAIFIIDQQVPIDCRLLNPDIPAKCFDSTFAYSQFIDLAFDRLQIEGGLAVSSAVLAAAAVVAVPLVFAGRILYWLSGRSISIAANWRPRAILSPLLVCSLAAGITINTLVFYASYIRVGSETLWMWLRMWLPRSNGLEASLSKGPAMYWLYADYGAIAETAQFQIVLLFVMVMAVTLYFMGATQGMLHLMRDVVDHQFKKKSFALLKLFGGRRSPPAWPRRERVRKRMDAMLNMLSMNQTFDRIVFLTHSQGSVIVYDYLSSDNLPSPLLTAASEIHVVSLGSPISHLYQYYFREYYELREKVVPVPIGNLISWTNMWRVDDAIGDKVSLGKLCPVVNRPLGPGGHSNYWRDENVRHLIRELILTPPTSHIATKEAMDTKAAT